MNVITSKPRTGPTPYQIQQAVSAAQAFRETLLADDPALADDVALMSDVLDAETDVLDIARRVLRYGLEAAALADAAAARIKALGERKARFTRREEAARQTAAQIMEAVGQFKLIDPEFTASIANGKPKVIITDEDLLPDDCIRTKREPDKAAIKALLDAGRFVEGAELSNSGTVLTVRTK